MEHTRKMYYCVIICLFCFLSACSKQINEDRNTNVYNVLLNDVSDNTESDDEKINSILGYWLLYEVAFRDIDRVTMHSRFKDGRDEDCIGKILEYKDSCYKLDDVMYNYAHYSFQEDDLYHLLHTTNVSKIDLMNFMLKYDIMNGEVIKVDINAKGYNTRDDRIGREFFIIDQNHLLVCVGGTGGWFIHSGNTSFDTRRLMILLKELKRKDEEILSLRKRINELEQQE